MNALFEFEGDVFAADAVAAVVVYPPDEDEEQWTVRLVLRGVSEPVNYFEDTEEAARKTQLRAVAAWKNALAQT